jgi:hypothetical protein
MFGLLRTPSKEKKEQTKMHCSPADFHMYEANPFTKGRFVVKSKEQFAEEMDEFLEKYGNSKDKFIVANTNKNKNVFDTMKNYGMIPIEMSKFKPLPIQQKEENCRNCGANEKENGKCKYCGTKK